MRAINLKSKKLCIFVNIDWFLLSHFTDYLLKCVALNYSVTVITSGTGRLDELRDIGVEVVEVNLYRGYRSLLDEVRSFFGIYAAIKKCSPDILELITIKPVIYGGLLAMLIKIKSVVFYMSGLGSVFTDNKKIGWVATKFILIIYKFIMRQKNVEIIVENEDDRKLMKQVSKQTLDRIHLVPGVGVDLKKFFPFNTEANKKIRIAIASRLLKDKGVFEFVAASRGCLKESLHAEFVAVGDIDPSNPASLTAQDLEKIKAEGAVQILGHQSNMEDFLRSIDIFVLPSYREGFPRAIMEAAATGLPVITTNVTGCRSAVINNVTGIIIPPQDSVALENAMKKMIYSSDLRSLFGRNARIHAEKMFDINILTAAHINAWNKNL